MNVNDNEIEKTLRYFLCANYFKWTPKQVDETEVELIDSLLFIYPLWKARTRDMEE